LIAAPGLSAASAAQVNNIADVVVDHPFGWCSYTMATLAGISQYQPLRIEFGVAALDRNSEWLMRQGLNNDTRAPPLYQPNHLRQLPLWHLHITAAAWTGLCVVLKNGPVC
jgi:hypothetical protein